MIAPTGQPVSPVRPPSTPPVLHTGAPPPGSSAYRSSRTLLATQCAIEASIDCREARIPLARSRPSSRHRPRGEGSETGKRPPGRGERARPLRHHHLSTPPVHRLSCDGKTIPRAAVVGSPRASFVCSRPEQWRRRSRPRLRPPPPPSRSTRSRPSSRRCVDTARPPPFRSPNPPAASTPVRQGEDMTAGCGEPRAHAHVQASGSVPSIRTRGSKRRVDDRATCRRPRLARRTRPLTRCSLSCLRRRRRRSRAGRRAWPSSTLTTPS